MVQRYWLRSLVCNAISFFGMFLIIASPGESATEKFQSNGKAIRVDWLESASTGNKPVVLILYGSSGCVDPAYFEFCAQQFAQAGYPVGIVHYFDAVGIASANPAQVTKYFGLWTGTIDDAIIAAQKKFGKQRKIDLFGYSLGAQLALLQAAHDPRVLTVASMSGNFVYKAKITNTNLTVLLLYGDRDTVVPLAKEKSTEAILKAAHVVYEKQVYAGQGHSFDWDHAQNALQKAIEFFRRSD